MHGGLRKYFERSDALREVPERDEDSYKHSSRN